MRAFPAERSAIAAALLALLGIAPALAQGTAPTSLIPDGAPAPLEAPPPVMPGDPGLVEAPTDQGPSGIEIGELREVDPDSGGLLDPSMGGLGIDMWAGTSRARMLRLLPQLPADYRSPTLHDMARRVLLSSAVAPPRGEGDPATSLIGLRIERLAAMGLTGAVAEMMGIAPAPASDATLMRIHVDNRLLLGDSAGACQAFAAGGEVMASPYREQVGVFCGALAGEKETAGVAANLLREGGDLDDPAFFALADALTAGLGVKLKSLPAPTPLHLAMAAQVKAKLPSDVLDSRAPLILRALADSPLVSGSVQLAAAEKAAQAGALSADDLAARYGALEFSKKELDNAISIAEREPSPRNRALLYQAAKLQKLPVGQAAAMQKAWALARKDGGYALSVAVYRAEIEALQPSAELLWFAPDAARALFLLNQPDKALDWAASAQRNAREEEEIRAAVLLWPLIALAEGSSTGGGHDRWLKEIGRRGPAEASLTAAYAYSLFEAMGERIPEARWEAAMTGGGRSGALAPNPAYPRAFREAAGAGRLGESVLLAAIVLGGGDPGGYGPGLISEIVIGLRRVGLEKEARQLAIEAALGAGL